MAILYLSSTRFVRDNHCTVEFDPFGFSVKDFQTRRVLLRCDSSGDLYPVTESSSIPHVFLTSQYTWHQRLGHPGSEVLRRVLSNNSISCNKEKSPVLCHACQLGKHVKLPFVSSSTFVSSCFDIIHSDLWTSPIPSLSGFKYYVVFLDHYSQYVWVYPLVRKSDVLSKFMLFRNFVHTQFKCEIKSFQCDHGGEFDNHTFHKLFASHGIQFRFSCPKTSQQNGKSKRMIRTINNLIRTLLFQANLPPNYWLEAFNMARILRYIRGTIDHGLQLFSASTTSLVAYSDADWAGCPTTRRSTSGYCVFLGNNLLSWSSKRQHTLSRSSAEAEYRGVANAVAETCWLRNLLRELHTPLTTATLVYCDNVSAVYLSSNPVQHQRTKHIEIDIHFVRDLVAAGHIRVLHVPSRYQFADIFTKGLPSALFEEFRSSLSVRCTPAPTAGECCMQLFVKGRKMCLTLITEPVCGCLFWKLVIMVVVVSVSFLLLWCLRTAGVCPSIAVSCLPPVSFLSTLACRLLLDDSCLPSLA
ncbi:ribonuclease H-like domain-containing protein [Tanacetum coccineum]|uniref:Ribonuclease H-like domain-containing protein n=1 Tax=Tanacetum coccineum TaxID=301880 RepID=A0ABQ5F8R6_9ASTR